MSKVDRISYINPETGEVLYREHEETYEDMNEILEETMPAGLIKHGAIICDHNDNRVEVTELGMLNAGPIGGFPQCGTDTAGADAYVAVVTAGRRCHFMSATCDTKGALLSLDGVSGHFALAAGTTIVWPGLDIPAGTTIYAINALAANNYANLYVTIW